MIDLHKNKKVVYDLLNKANIPSKLIDDARTLMEQE